MQACELLVIGSGGTGLSAALEAASAGARVTVVTKQLPTRAQTCMAQGGINAALGNVEPDSVEEHVADTLRSAHGLADEARVRRLCEAAPETVEWLDRMLVPFSRREGARNALESIAQRRLGGASHPRACYAQDYTGLKILQSLYDRCLEAGVRFVTEHMLLDLAVTHNLRGVERSPFLALGHTPHPRVLGGIFWDIRRGEVATISARATLLATGGYGELFHGYTTNAAGATGDGIAAALRAGAILSDREFVQFHPTALEGSAILISESARGAGGHLVTETGERFTDELAPRDEVARAIFRQVQAGHRVFLDLRHLGEKTLTELMPQELRLARLHAGVDPLMEPIPILPAVHYTMGGIEVDDRFRVEGLEGAYAAGECSNAHIHGANRLGGNSLLEIIAFGRMAARHALEHRGEEDPRTLEELARLSRNGIETLFRKPDEINLYHKRKILGKRLFHDLGIVRDAALMEDAEKYLDTLLEKLPRIGLGDKERSNNRQLVEYLEFDNALLLALATTQSARLRTESRGAHWRSDYPEEDPAWARHSYCRLREGAIECW
jgi:succinate dehydrogenase / fumarate reductase flavoprotein subunit